METKEYKPDGLAFKIAMGFSGLFMFGLSFGCLFIFLLESSMIHLLVAIMVICVLLYEFKKMITWKVVFYESHLYVPSSDFDEEMFGKKRIQKIYYSQIEEICFDIYMARIIIKCRSETELNKIFVKQFSKKAIEQMLEEIIARVVASGAKRPEFYIDNDISNPSDVSRLRW